MFLGIPGKTIGYCTAWIGAALIGIGVSVSAASAQNTSPLVPESAAPAVRPSTLPDVLEKVTPAVVNIAVASRSSSATNPLYNDPFFRRFFNLPEMPQERPRMSAGSGVIVDAAHGYILTNHHVVSDADEIAVTLKDRRRFTAELVGSDQATDIALLKIDADNLTAIQMGDSNRLRVGESVVAIGNPFGLGQTVTSGIVSALGRSGINIEGYEDFIQTDASINPGNSGGALITVDGKLVGINTAIIAPAGGNVGIGFAIPSNMAAAVMRQLIEHGEVRRGRLGVAIQDLTPDLADALGIEDSVGAVISSVEDGSPAAQAGLQAGDVVVSMNGQPISGSTDLRNRIGLTPVGQEIQLTLWRDGEQKTLKVRIAEAEEAGAEAAVPEPLSGAHFQDDGDNVFVAEVDPESNAARAGLRPGDVIAAVNRQPVRSVAELSEALRNVAGTIALDIVRGGARLFLVIR